MTATAHSKPVAGPFKKEMQVELPFYYITLNGGAFVVLYLKAVSAERRRLL